MMCPMSLLILFKSLFHRFKGSVAVKVVGLRIACFGSFVPSVVCHNSILESVESWGVKNIGAEPMALAPSYCILDKKTEMVYNYTRKRC